MTEILLLVRNRIVPGLLIVFSLYHGVISLLEERTRERIDPNPDPVRAYAESYRSLRDTLAGRGCLRVRYISDTADAPSWFEDYVWMQYALAPIVIGDSSDCRLVVVRRRGLPAGSAAGPSQGLVLIRDYDNDVSLFSEQAQ